MADTKENLKVMLQKKSLAEIDALISAHKQQIAAKKDLMTLNKLNSELKIMLEVKDQKMIESKTTLIKTPKAAPKPELKSYEDYVKSKK